ncbi:hypothetical protein MSIMFB_01080 [Mycobacterium simulans]|uniref:Uncharacterized protein n=1 Tax=Mycobacterium simulans TaxID=627089 RepID=A0A7Z7N988_9MYCO|nr:hypothetical protein [Mycobacterium simulans]SOJ53580.1 hypothetical protein MSIMFB_01080 [Mycobacterium simulans]
MHDHDRDPLAEAFYRCAEYGGGNLMTISVDLDRSTVILGEPGLYDGLAIAQWSDD